MRIPSTLALVSALIAVSAMSPSAHADGAYVSESFGGADVGDDLAGDTDSTFRMRFAGGYRAGAWAVEGWLGVEAGLGMASAAQPGYGAPCDCAQPYDDTISGLFSYGVNVKYLKPVARNLDVYLRGGLAYGHLDGEYQGRGLEAGAGLQIKGKVPALGLLFWPLFFTNLGPKITAAAFVDTGTAFYRFHRDGIVGNGSKDGRFDSLMVGLAFGSDF